MALWNAPYFVDARHKWVNSVIVAVLSSAVLGSEQNASGNIACGELSLSRGDDVLLLRQIDRNWLEGQCRGMIGVFPGSYVEVDNASTYIDY